MRAQPGPSLFPSRGVRVVTKWLRKSRQPVLMNVFAFLAARRLRARPQRSIWRDGLHRRGRVERETILFPTQTWELKYGFAMVFFSMLLELDQRVVETYLAEGRGTDSFIQRW